MHKFIGDKEITWDSGNLMNVLRSSRRKTRNSSQVVSNLLPIVLLLYLYIARRLVRLVKIICKQRLYDLVNCRILFPFWVIH